MAEVYLADEFFLIALDDRTGKPRLSGKVLGLGLASALLVELMLEERITVAGDRVRVLSRRPPADPLAGTILHRLVMEIEDHPIRTWLSFLALNATGQVADRLWRAGLIRQERSRFRRAATTYPPTDPNTAFGPTARLATKLRGGQPLTWPEAALCGLVKATDLDGHLLANADTQARRYLRHIIEHFPPSLLTLVEHLHAAVGDAAMTGHT